VYSTPEQPRIPRYVVQVFERTFLGTYQQLNQQELPYAGDLAAGDFDGDGFADLAVGAPQQEVRGRFSAGSVTVLYGTPAGLTAVEGQAFTQATRGIAGSAGDLHLFGWSLSAAHVGRGAADDLAVGTPLDAVGRVQQAGSVTVLYGSSSDGLRPGSSRRWTQDGFGVGDRSERGDLFGWSLATGDLGHSGLGDLAVGVPGEDVGGRTDAGAVSILYGRARGLASRGSQFLTRRSAGIAGRPRGGDAFGTSLAVGDLGLTAFGDLAIGVPGDDVPGAVNGGAVNVIYGSRRGLLARGNQLWTRSHAGLSGDAQPREAFGSALGAAQFGRFGHADLAIGVPRHDIGSVRDAGAVVVLYGSTTGLRGGGSQLWTRASPGIAGVPHRGDRFGRAVA
jgi:hypothetical protein